MSNQETPEEMRGRILSSIEASYRSALLSAAKHHVQAMEDEELKMRATVEQDVSHETGLPLDIVKQLGQRIKGAKSE